ncbi:hypothetical protein RKD25_009076 [Streptomyces sp. SAI-124]|uniref:methyltransferase family protein n=1 Tax=Streptomyces sp. SAI-124 TaxID=3377730 RepID=UPI003C7E49F8
MSETAPGPAPAPSLVMTQLLGGFQVSQALYVVTKLGICTMLEDGPLSVGDLAERSGAKPQPLSRLIRTLAMLGLFRTDGELVETTPLGAPALPDAPGDARECGRDVDGDALRPVR